MHVGGAKTLSISSKSALLRLAGCPVLLRRESSELTFYFTFKAVDIEYRTYAHECVGPMLL